LHGSQRTLSAILDVGMIAMPQKQSNSIELSLVRRIERLLTERIEAEQKLFIK
jgi:hypothetical protein